jgi:rhodanese-related sulfurtransferase
MVDVRGIEAFADGHVPGALSNPWRSQFATWLGWLVPRGTPLVFIADAEVDRQDLVWAALTVGFENVLGELAGGIAAWTQARRSVSRIPIIDHPDRARAILDVRQSSEHRSGHLPEAIHIELGQIAEAANDLPRTAMLVHCGRGERAMTAASLLARAGHSDTAVFAGEPARLGTLVSEG